MKFVFRVLLVILSCYLLLLAVTSIRRYFDEEDLTKAKIIFLKYRLPEAIDCEFQLLSRYEGRVQVVCQELFVWEIDVISSQLVPKNNLAKRLSP